MPLFAALDRLKADLDILRPLAPEQEQRVLQKFRLEWNYHSNAIEGNSLTLGETRSLLLHGLTAAGKSMRDHLDIKGHNEAVLWLEDFVRDERPLTEQFIRGMHEVLLGEAYEVPAQTPDGQPTRKTIRPGQYKTSPNNVLTATGEMFYFASPEETPAMMTDLVDWYRQQDADPTLHPVALAAEFHYRFVRIHPFGDGNGRMSRLLMNLILMRRGYAITVIKATDRNRYLAALSEADAGEFEPFLSFIIENVEASLRLMIRAAQGESIDEPNDLDKKLALLKKQVLNREGTVEKMWTYETQADIAQSILEPWLNDLSSQLARFDPFFLNRKSTATIVLQGYSEANVIELADLETAGEMVKNNIKEISGFCAQIRILIHWETFRNFLTPFDANAEITFTFKPFEFDIQHEVNSGSISEFEKASGFDRTTVYSTPYRHNYNTEFIGLSNYKLANTFYYLIEKELKKEDEIAAKKSSYDEEDRDLPF